jgi:hypothetical protein
VGRLPNLEEASWLLKILELQLVALSPPPPPLLGQEKKCFYLFSCFCEGLRHPWKGGNISGKRDNTIPEIEDCACPRGGGWRKGVGVWRYRRSYASNWVGTQGKKELPGLGRATYCVWAKIVAAMQTDRRAMQEEESMLRNDASPPSSAASTHGLFREPTRPSPIVQEQVFASGKGLVFKSKLGT